MAKLRSWNWGNIIRWVAVGYMLCFFFVFHDSAGAALFFGLAAVISAPIPPIDRCVKAKRGAFICLQLVLALTLFFIGVCLTPSHPMMLSILRRPSSRAARWTTNRRGPGL